MIRSGLGTCGPRVPRDVGVIVEGVSHDPREEVAARRVCDAVVRAGSRRFRAFGNFGSGLAAVTTCFVGGEKPCETGASWGIAAC